MISSEVQRTLVKSPPELWTELSDPEALSRHLGALGEIKITRTEPEALIEWEAERTTGTVAIKASGWGTKVTLTVSRESSAGVSGEPAAPPTEATEPGGDGPNDDDLPATGEASEGEKTSEVRAVDEESRAGSGEPTASEPEPAHETSAPVRDEPELEHPMDEPALASEVKPAPATEAARRAAGWPTSPPAGPGIESDLRAAEAATPEGPGPQPRCPDAIEPEPAANAPDPEPRLGFFARLFGRRRRRTDVVSSAAVTEHDAILSTEAELEAVATEQPSFEPAPLPAPVKPGGDRADHPEPIDPAEQPTLAEEAAPAEQLADEANQPGHADEAEQPQPLDRPQLADIAAEPALSGETGQPEHSDEPSEPELAPETSATAGRSAAPEASIAAELKAAEEVTAEEVTAVLTGVLDRLGAAHHRPFSRA